MRSPYRRISVPGGAIAASVTGAGTPIALVHGGTGTAAYDWEFVLEPLAQRHTVVAMDMRGHGHSPAPDGRLGVTRFALDTAAVMLRLGFPRFAALGFSAGANALVELASLHPWRVTTLFTVGASIESHPERVDEILTGPWPSGLSGLRHPGSGDDPDHWKWLRAKLARDWADNLAFTATQLAGIDAKLVAFHGADDAIVDVDQAHRLAAAVPNARAVIVAGAGHAVARDQPKALLETILR